PPEDFATRGRIVRVDAIERTRAHHLLGLVSQHPFDRGALVPVDAVGPQDRGDVGGVLDQPPVMLLALTEGLLRAVTIRDVARNGDHLTIHVREQARLEVPGSLLEIQRVLDAADLTLLDYRLERLVERVPRLDWKEITHPLPD